MWNPRKEQAVTELERIPSMTRSLAEDLYDLGYRSVASLRGQSPEAMYTQLCSRKGLMKIDKGMLYVFRTAVYYASNERHDPELLKWWNWRQ